MVGYPSLRLPTKGQLLPGRLTGMCPSRSRHIPEARARPPVLPVMAGRRVGGAVGPLGACGGLKGGAAARCRANIKVSSTETGAIFGNIVYEATGYAERSVVVLADIHIDIMDYISPAACADVQFRAMWAEFEWENKVRPPSRWLPARARLASSGAG